MTPTQALRELFLAVFEEGTLEMFLDDHYPKISSSISWDQATDQAAHSVAKALTKRGRVDPSLFAKLIATRPGQEALIREKAAACGVILQRPQELASEFAGSNAGSRSQSARSQMTPDTSPSGFRHSARDNSQTRRPDHGMTRTPGTTHRRKTVAQRLAERLRSQLLLSLEGDLGADEPAQILDSINSLYEGFGQITLDEAKRQLNSITLSVASMIRRGTFDATVLTHVLTRVKDAYEEVADQCGGADGHYLTLASVYWDLEEEVASEVIPRATRASGFQASPLTFNQERTTADSTMRAVARFASTERNGS
jgi:hypothetical protein